MNTPYCFKRCTVCGEWKVVNIYNFYKKKSGKWGLDSRCKECKSKIRKNKWETDYEYRNEYNKKQREKHREKYANDEEYKNKLNKKQREKYANDEEYRNKCINRKLIKLNNDEEYREEYYKKQREKYANDEEYRNKILKRQKRDRENNPHKEFNKCSKRRQNINNQNIKITKEQWYECFEFFNWKCAYSGELLKNTKDTYGRTLDHIVALDNGGLNAPWNCVPMRKGYNSSKCSRTDTMTWYIEQEYFNKERLNKIVEWQIYAYEKWGGEEFGELILITDLIEN